MRAALLALYLASGCGQSAEDKLRALVDQMCECSDQDCVVKVNAEMVREGSKLITDPTQVNPVPPALRPRYNDCMSRVMTGGRM